MTMADSDVDVAEQRIVLDELAARLDDVAHQLVEQHVGFVELPASARTGSIERALTSSVVLRAAPGFISPRRLAPASTRLCVWRR